MVIDKTGIMKILRANKEELEKHPDEDSIMITTRYNDFSPKTQIRNDSIDLRISNTGYTLSSDYEFINTLSDEDFSKYFTSVALNSGGYDLKPNDLLFIDTVEQIHLSGNLIGRITGRSVFSRFGLSVHCTQDKFSSGINSIAALQIVNNSNTTLKIFPYQKLVQLIIEKTEPNNNPYNYSTFSLEERYTLPKIKSQDREQYDNRTQTRILDTKPKRKGMLKSKSKAPKANVLFQALCGGFSAVAFGVLGLFPANILTIISMIIIGLFYIIISTYLVYIAGQQE